ncbi:MAG: hypothetical protein M3Y18_08030 [Candidatus Eremiobacteraeota bacterium]|nr:hypothetical protein [Candidatus Eremiobacteraeota bacterium]
MKRLISSVMAMMLLAAGPAVASKMHKHSMMHHGMMTRSHCSTGMHYVHGFKRNGKMVKGYCRKGMMK